MAVFAVIENNIVVNSIIADTVEIAEAVTGLTCIATAHPIGTSHDPETGIFTEPVAVEVAVEVPAPAELAPPAA